MPGTPLPEALIEKLKPVRRALQGLRNTVVPVVGSGLSQGLRSWPDLLGELATELPEDVRQDVLELLAKEKYLEAASEVEHHPAVGRPRVCTTIKECYQRPTAPRPAVYDRLASLPIDHFVTTNYDPWLKDALAGARRACPRVFGPGDPGGFADLLQESSPLVLMVHGDADRPETCVLSSEGYRDLVYRNQEWLTGMRSLTSTRRLLFLGYSLSDPDLLRLLEEWQALFAPGGGATRHWLFGASLSQGKMGRFRRLGVEPIDYGSHALLPDILRHLASPPEDVPELTRGPDLRPYLVRLEKLTSHIDIVGIGAGLGKVKTASRYRIEELYTPLSTGLPAQGLEARLGSEPSGERRTELARLLPRYERLLIEGQPGAGKTTFLRLVACMLARDALDQPGPDGERYSPRVLGLDQAELPIPVFIRASTLVPLFEQHQAGNNDDRWLLLRAIEASSADGEARVPKEHWASLLDSGKAWLLLDGLDEVADEGLRQRLLAVLRDATEHCRCRMVVTSRPIHTEAFLDLGFARAVIEPFGPSEVAEFVEHWVRALFGQAQGEPLESDGRAYRDKLFSAVAGRAPIRRMASNPVMLTCLCVVHHNEGELPEGRTRLLRAVFEWLLRAKSPVRTGQGFRDEFARYAFEQLAWAMTGGPKGKRAVLDLGDAVEAIEPELEREFPGLDPEQRARRGRAWLEFECLGSGIIERLPGSQIKFWHLMFQEYLAAVFVSRRKDWWTLIEPHLGDLQWRETVDFLPGCLFDGTGRDRVDDLLTNVLALKHDDSLGECARITALLSRLLGPLSVCGYEPPESIQRAYAEGLGRSEAIFTLEGAQQVPVKTRIEVGEALGRAGDWRLKPERDNFLPIPGGAGVYLAKYPVTVEEYERFVEAGGYDSREYWCDEGWAAKEKERWTSPREWDKQVEAPNRPVVRVSWYEACAYCRWLGAHKDREMRLPTEAEWEAAATSPEGEYPWGAEEPDEESANFANNVGRPTPVGIYPGGDAPGGHTDLGGNVWEWCEDERGGERSVRGGSWGYPAGYLRSAFRGRGWADRRGADLGFRVAAGRPSR
jgi:hypothetical protein